jgi:hypothetical protein
MGLLVCIDDEGNRTVRKRGIHLLCFREPIHDTKHHTFRSFAAALVRTQMLRDRNGRKLVYHRPTVPLTTGMSYR